MIVLRIIEVFVAFTANYIVKTKWVGIPFLKHVSIFASHTALACIPVTLAWRITSVVFWIGSFLRNKFFLTNVAEYFIRTIK